MKKRLLKLSVLVCFLGFSLLLASSAFAFTLTVNKTGNGIGTVTSNPAGINCGTGGTACTAEFTDASVVTLTASLNPASIFTGSPGGPEWNANTLTIVNESSTVNIDANFIVRPPNYVGCFTFNVEGFSEEMLLEGTDPISVADCVAAAAANKYLLLSWYGTSAMVVTI